MPMVDDDKENEGSDDNDQEEYPDRDQLVSAMAF
jgi:hypothetical protein